MDTDLQKNFDQLFRSHYKMAVLFAHKYVGDVDTARDIAQEVFIKLYEKVDHSEIRTSIKSYILTAVKNNALNYLRGKTTRDRYHDQASYHLEQDYEHRALELEELKNKIKYELNQLPPRCKEIFEMNRFEGLKNREIADKLSISIRTVETQISNAIKHLRATIPKESMLAILFLLTSTCIVPAKCLSYEYGREFFQQLSPLLH